jgi:protein-disulfide isomerase
MHPLALGAAEAAEAAGAQGKFWEMHDRLFENQRALDHPHLVQSARELGLDVPRFETALAEHTYANRVHEDFLSGARSGVNGTPTFYINGRRHDGSYDLETLVAAIERAG